MTTAQRMNEIAIKARTKADEELAEKYDLYVRTLIGGKIMQTAKKGKNECIIKVKKSVPVFEVVDRLQKHPRGFEATAHYNGHRKTVTVKW